METDSTERFREGGAAAVLKMEPGSSVSVAYHPEFGPHSDLMLLEVDEKLLPEFLNQRVTLRGQQDEDAVLCTQSKTYAVKFVGTSNSVFLVPPSDQYGVEGRSGEVGMRSVGKVRASVLKVAQGSMELVEVAPRIDKLKKLLMEKPYMSSDVEMGESDEEIGLGLYSWGDLVAMVQASDDELRLGLEALSALEIDGYWRIVDEQYMDLILNMMLHNIVLNDWSFDALDENEVAEVLKSDGFSPNLSRHCLKVYGQRVDTDMGAKVIWMLEEKKVCVHFAKKILRGGKIKKDAFMNEWVKKIPKGMHGSFGILEGEVLTEDFGIDTWVRAFSVSSLPHNPAERFAILFKEQAKWELKDLQPYIRDLSVPGSSLEDLLLKYTRRTQVSSESEPIFSAR